MTACPICSASAAVVFDCQGYPIHNCVRCQHRFTNPPNSNRHVEDTYGDDYFFGGGAGYADYLSEEQLLLRHAQQYVDLVGRYRPPGVMLDVGAAAGFNLERFAAAGWRTQGVEPNPQMAIMAGERSGANVFAGTLETFSCDRKFDLITMIQVIAHFHDLSEAIARAGSLTSPGGYWLIETWNVRSLTARLFGRHWHEYSPPSVLHWFSRNSITQLAARHGMSPVAYGRPVKKLDGQHAKSLLQYRAETSMVGRVLSQFARLLPDGMHLRYPAEDLFWMLFQKDSSV